MSQPQIGVGAIVVHDGALLMVQRGHNPGAGLWSIPGGRLEQGELISDALVREVREETGIDIEVGPLAGVLEVPGNDLHYVILDHFATVTGNSDPVAGADAARARWVPLDEVKKLDCTPRFVETMRAWGVLARDE